MISAASKWSTRSLFLNLWMSNIKNYIFFSLFSGDRYWYENDIPPSSFTKDQLNEIRKVKLAQVLCENIPTIDFVQPNVFLESDPFLNALMPCRGETILHSMNLVRMILK